LRKFTLSELLDRARQALLSRLESMPYVRNWVLRGGEECLAVGSATSISLGRISELISVSCASATGEQQAMRDSDQEKALRYAADAALEGKFDLLGMRQLFFGRPVDWHRDPMSGNRTPLVPWKRLDSLPTGTGGDIKVVWELNRHQHLVTFGRAFMQFGDERYAAALSDHITGWIRDNPPGLGVNWMSSLEMAFRCISWLWSIAMVRTWSKWPSLPLLDIERSFYVHGQHIERYLSTFFSPNTHLTGEGLGLYYLGTCLPQLKCAERWRNLGRAILVEQLEVQVRPDGVYFEQSTWYQRYTADFYTHFIILAERTGDAIPPRVSDRLAALLDYLMWITRPDGTSPYIGDDDGGKLIRVEACAPNDWRAVLSNGAVMFGRGDYKYVASKCAVETCRLFGSGAKERFDRIWAKPPDVTSRAFADGGFFVMRSGWANDSNYLLVDCGPHGAMNCGHAHADALAIEVAALGTTVLIDPGTCTYTGSAVLRDLFRSTAMHNSVTIDGLSSSVPAGPFKWKHVAKCTTHCWHDHPMFTYFEGSHDGYKRLSDAATHTRCLLFVNREYWIMLDSVNAEAGHEYAVHFHMAPGVNAILYGESGRLAAQADSATLDIIYAGREGIWNVADGLVSPSYGAKETARHGTYSARSTGAAALLSVLFPRRPDQPAAEIHNLNLVRGKGLTIATPQFCDFVLWSGSAAVTEGLHSVDFEWVWMRRSAGDRLLERAVFVHGTSIRSDQVEVASESPVEFVAISVCEKVLSVDVLPSVGMRIVPLVHVDRIVVNGRVHAASAREAVTIVKDEMPILAVPRDQIDCCRHVRH